VCTAKDSDNKEKRRDFRHAVSVSSKGVRHIPTKPQTLGPVSLRIHQVQDNLRRADWSHPSEPADANSQIKLQVFCESQPPT
jgi:hypothetical protein